MKKVEYTLDVLMGEIVDEVWRARDRVQRGDTSERKYIEGLQYCLGKMDLELRKHVGVD